ncbi:hypothetical protein GCM10011378_41450 [Hymenobacter glacieicola]|uniref:Uncharacterized protein n=1 Tax=Hymenobacter glacieicola TaxID=1562124 RepID=A0ABQ1X8H0_9BACT|nr:hypothetical protein GCM10011378_41450 [Hymenobacter glacieicola]
MSKFYEAVKRHLSDNKQFRLLIGCPGGFEAARLMGWNKRPLRSGAGRVWYRQYTHIPLHLPCYDA